MMEKKSGIAVERVKAEITKDEFRRRIFIELAKLDTTPYDIFTSSFGEIEESEIELVKVEADVNIKYSCSVGYDKEQKYYENGQEKKRTVTQWQPYNGENSSHEHVVTKNSREFRENIKIGEPDSHYSFDESDFFGCYFNCKEESKVIDSGVEFVVDGEALDNARYLCRQECFARVNLPGDRQQDKKCWGEVNVQDSCGVILPMYTFKYNYNNKVYGASGIVCGRVNSKWGYPDTASDVRKAAHKKAKFLLYLALIPIICGLVLQVVGVMKQISLMSIFAPIMFVAAIALFIGYFILKNKHIKRILSQMKDEKIKGLKDCLKKFNLPELTDEEFNSILKITKNIT